MLTEKTYLLETPLSQQPTNPPVPTDNPLNITRKTYLAIFSLACGTFALGTNEFVPLSFLSQIAETYSVSVPDTSWVMSSFMIGAAVSSPIIAIMATGLDRKYLLVSLQSLLVVAATTCALAPDFSTLMVGRVLSSISHSAYMGIGAVAAAELVHESQRGYASSLFFSGLALANIIGVPLDTLLGTHSEWRDAFWPVVALAFFSASGIMGLVPKVTNESKTNIRKELEAFKKPELWLAFLTSTFGYAGMLSSHTYFSQMMIDLAGYSQSDMTWLTILYGVGAVSGTFFGGKVADVYDLHRSVPTLLATLAGVLFLFTVTVDYKIPAAMTLFANGFTGFSLVTPLMRYTISKAPEGKNLPAASNISAFGAGTALGIILGGIAIDHGFGYRSPNWVGGSLATIGLLFFCLSEHFSPLRSKPSVSDAPENTSTNTDHSYASSPLLLFRADGSIKTDDVVLELSGNNVRPSLYGSLTEV